MSRPHKAALGALAGISLASGAWVAVALHPPAAAQAPGHFAGKASITPLFHDCKDKAGKAILGTKCPILSDGRQLWAISGSARFSPTGALAGDVITLQPGTQTDLASIPRLVSNVYPPDGPWVMAALFHDLCYRSQGSFVAWGRAGHTRAQPYTRAECDELLRQGMVALGVSDFQRVTVFEAVRMGGAKGFGH